PGQVAVPGGPLAGGLLPQLRMTMTYRPGQTLGARPPLIDQAAIHRVERYLQTQDAGPVDSLYLAVRQARTALAEAPDDVLGRWTLAEASGLPRSQTREQVRVAVRPADNRPEQVFFPPVPSIRQTQAAAAWRNVLKLATRPELQTLAH